MSLEPITYATLQSDTSQVCAMNNRSDSELQDSSSNWLESFDPSEDGADNDKSYSTKDLIPNDDSNLGDIVNENSHDILVETVLEYSTGLLTIFKRNNSTKSPPSPALISSSSDDSSSSSSSEVVLTNNTVLTADPKDVSTEDNNSSHEKFRDANKIWIHTSGKSASTPNSIPADDDHDDEECASNPPKEQIDSTGSIHGDVDSIIFKNTTLNEDDSSNDEDHHHDGLFARLKNPRVAGGMIFCFCIIVILQVVTAVYLLSPNTGDDHHQQDISSTDRSIPSHSPSGIPTTSPTSSSPTVSPSEFQSIANLPGSVLLETVSSCNDCIENVTTVPLIPWSDQENLFSVQVSSDGRVVVDCKGSINSDQVTTIIPCGSIHVVDINLAPHVFGDVYYYYYDSQNQNQDEAFLQGRDYDSLVISWETAWLFGNWFPNDDPFHVNAQVIISSNQQVEICYGEGDTGGDGFRAGYYNYTTTTNEEDAASSFIPFVGPTFDGNGLSTTFPSNTCQILKKKNHPPDAGVTSSPSQTPTRRPSFRPTTALPTSSPSQTYTTARPTYHSNTPWPTSRPTISPNWRPSLRPTTAPRPSTPLNNNNSNGCVPTNGKCAETEDDLMAFLNPSFPGDVIAVCGIMSVKDAILVVQSNITVCCSEGSDCSLDSSSDGSKSGVLSVLGANFTLRGIQIQGGNARSRGGNLLIDAAGHHVIQDARLIGGIAGEYGGNLHVSNAASITISGSTFESGTGMNGGGAVAFENTPKVIIEYSSLKGNFVPYEGGAMLFFSSSDRPIPHQEVIIDRTVVENNSAMIGGGFLARNMDKLSLTVRDCIFRSNSVNDGSPMGHFHLVSTADLIFRNNLGEDFQGFNELCDSITIARFEPSETRCTVIPRGKESNP